MDAISDLAVMKRNAAKVAGLLRELANERRLMMLCKLAEAGEVNAGMLAETIGLSQSALSQHLARLREEGIVTTRKEAQMVWYSIADPKLAELLGTLQRLYCSSHMPKRIRASKTPTKGD